MKKPGRIVTPLRIELSILFDYEVLEDDLRNALQAIHDGEEPNKAFGWHRKPGKERDPKIEIEEQMMGGRVIYLNREFNITIRGSKDTTEDAIGRVARETKNLKQMKAGTEELRRKMRDAYESVIANFKELLDPEGTGAGYEIIKNLNDAYIGGLVVYLNRQLTIPINDAIFRVARETDSTETKVRECYRGVYKAGTGREPVIRS